MIANVPGSRRFASVAPFSQSPSAKPIAGWSEPVPGRKLQPLKSSSFLQRTISPVVQCPPRDPIAGIGMHENQGRQMPLANCFEDGRQKQASLTMPRLPEKVRSEEHTSELQSRGHLVCRLLLEKKKHPSRSAPIPDRRAADR